MRSPRCSAARSSSAVSARSTRSDARPRRGRSLRKRPQLLHITRSYPSAGLQMRAIAIDESDASHPRQPPRGAIRAMRRRAAARSISGVHSRSTPSCTRRTGAHCSAVALRSETLRWGKTDDTGSRDRRTSGVYPERRQQSGAVVPSDRVVSSEAPDPAKPRWMGRTTARPSAPKGHALAPSLLSPVRTSHSAPRPQRRRHGSLARQNRAPPARARR